MANEDAKQDNNHKPVNLAITNDSNEEIRMFRVNPTTGSLLVETDGFDDTSDSIKVLEQSPDRNASVVNSLLDTTNIAATTNYYPAATGMSMDGYKDLSLTGKFVDADGTMTLTIEVTNDEDTTNGDWIQIYGFDIKNNIMANSWAVTNNTLTFAILFDNLNYSYFRIKMVNDGATNTGIIKIKRKSL